MRVELHRHVGGWMHSAVDGIFVSDRDGFVMDGDDVREFPSIHAALDYIAAATAPPAPTIHEGQATMFDADDYDKCPECNANGEFFVVVLVRDDTGNIVGCTDCYINPDCPASCSTPHPAPTGCDGEWECPATGEVYHWCEGCNEWVTDEYGYGAVVYGDWLCDPYEHGYSRCDDCSEWFPSDESYYDEATGDGTYCHRCWVNNGHDREPDDEGEGYTTTPQCDRCGHARPLTHIDEDSEDALCEPCATVAPTERPRRLMAVAA